MEGEGCRHVYKYCMRNLTTDLGAYTTDGCGEFLPADDASQTDGSKLLCAACGCHRSFHWKHAPDFFCPNPLRTVPMPPEPMTPGAAENQTEVKRRKRERTKFTPEQKERMRSLAESLRWRLSNSERNEETEKFLAETGVSRKVFKVWMHNHRNEATKARAVVVSSGTEHDDGHAPDVNAAIVALVPTEDVKA